jgi:hypothetical protein
MVSFMALKTGAQVTVIRLPMVSSVFELTLLAACSFTRGQSWSRLRRLSVRLAAENQNGLDQGARVRGVHALNMNGVATSS